MARRDLEDILADIETVLKANLNTEIAAVEAEKVAAGKPATNLKPVATSSYFLQSWADNILNASPALFYGVEQIQANGVGPATLEVYKIFVEIVFVDSGNDKVAQQRAQRYARAVKQVFEKNWNSLPGGSEKTNIETVVPLSFPRDANTSEEVKVCGVSITTALA